MKQRLGPPEMVLAHPFTTIHLLRERWLVSSREFRPQINLSIHANLRTAQWNLPPETAYASDFHQETKRPAFSFAQAVGPLRERVLRAGALHDGAEPDRPEGSLTAIRDSVNLAVIKPASGESANRQTEQVNEESRTPRATGVLDNAEAIAKRLARQTRRVEEGVEKVEALTVRRAGVARERRTPSTVSSAVETARSAIATTAAPAGAMQDPSGGRGLNIDLLTDRVMRELDRRVVSARERMGRI